MVLKGKIAKKKMKLSLCYLPLGALRKRESKGAEFNFNRHECYLVFLKKKTDPDRAPYTDADYWSMSYSGGIMPVAWRSVLSKPKGGNPKQIISKLLEDFLEYKREELKSLEHHIKIVLGKE